LQKSYFCWETSLTVYSFSLQNTTDIFIQVLQRISFSNLPFDDGSKSLLQNGIKINMDIFGKMVKFILL